MIDLKYDSHPGGNVFPDGLENGPLPDGKGPLRLIVPGEKKPARSSFQVTALIIRYAKE
ncbi:hypothetical protein [Chitinophaga sp. S165]|uniref:hypothetical protein n=1 Tax=Chitinophaga sp. S165 TaxID=2135462 RepID=UPI000D8FAF90|nr:hypothetical protein [Chitinophaga sp. S165]PWV55976.1 hypothetical protein C7475_101488 [Chitinophaga sp. S165]